MQALKKLIKKMLLLPGLRTIPERMIIGRYIRDNARSRNGQRIDTPWICEFRDSDPERWIRYKDEVVSDYFRLSGLPREAVRGKLILEIGPGETLAVALELLMAGASRVVCTDRFPSLAPIPAQLGIYRAMRAKLDEARVREFDAIITLREESYILNPERLVYRTGAPLETLARDIPDRDFDIILSRAVLEHVYDLDQAMDSMDALLVPGGVLLHEVDFRDHGMFTYFGLNPLTFLTVPDAEWVRLGSHIGAPNRRLLDFFEAKLRTMGYSGDMMVRRAFGSDTVLDSAKLVEGRDYGPAQVDMVRSIRRRLLPRYRNLPLETLLVSVIFMTARKPAMQAKSAQGAALS